MLLRVRRWLVHRWLLWMAIIALLALIISRRVAVQGLVATLRTGSWPWIAVAVAFQVLYYLLFALLYHQAFQVVRVASRWRDIVPLVYAATFLNALSPSGGIAGSALYIGYAVKRGQTAARATEGVLLEAAVEAMALLPVLLGGLAALLFRGALATYQVVGALMYTAYTALLAIILLLAHWSPRYLARLLAGLQGLVSHIVQGLGRRDPLPADWARRNTIEVHGAANAIVANPRQVGRMLAVALGIELMNLATLYALFCAFHVQLGAGALTAGYALGMVFAVITIIPYSIGVLQGVMGLVYVSLGAPAPVAVAVVVAFGGINAWLPVMLGFLFLRRLRSRG